MGDEGPNITVYIKEEAISLSLITDRESTDIGVSEVKRHGWELRLLVRPPTVSWLLYCVMVSIITFLQLLKSILDGYEKGKLIPHFELNLTLRREESSPQSFSQEVHFTGIHEPTSIVLSRDPATPEGLLCILYPSVCYGNNNSKSDACERVKIDKHCIVNHDVGLYYISFSRTTDYK